MADDIPLSEFGEHVLDDPAGDDIATTSLSNELLTETVDGYYNALAEDQGVGQPSVGRDYQKFEIDRRGQLRLKAYPEIDLIHKHTGRPLKISSIASKRGGGTIIRNELGFTDWVRKSNLPAAAAAKLRQADEQMSAVEGRGDIEMADLDRAAATLFDAEETALKTIEEPPLDTSGLDRSELMMRFRELQGLDKAMRTQRGELVNNLARLSEIDKHISKEQRKLEETDDEQFKRDISDRIKNLEDERAARLEAASTNREALRSQISRIRETLQRILHEDTTLAERIKTLFREQGITIASVLTAIGMAISTLVLALTGGGGGAPSTSPPSNKSGVKEWVKKQLQALGRLLVKLAGKALDALPGIIGSVVSWLLSTASKAVGWLAEHTWAIFVAIGGLLLIAAREWLTKHKPKGE